MEWHVGRCERLLFECIEEKKQIKIRLESAIDKDERKWCTGHCGIWPLCTMTVITAHIYCMQQRYSALLNQ